jgi:hypothetical protein
MTHYDDTMACDYYVTAIITTDGKLNTFNTLDPAHKQRSDLQTINLADAVVSMAFNHRGMVIMTARGEVYLREHYDISPTPTLLGLPSPAKEIVCQTNLFYIITVDGSLYSLNHNNRLSHVAVPEQVVSISSGSVHTLILTITCNVYGFGGNWFGQVGNGTFETVTSPVLIELPSPCKSIVTGVNSSVAILETGEMYGWGMLCGRPIVTRPQLVQFDRELGVVESVAPSTPDNELTVITKAGKVYSDRGNGFVIVKE